MIVAHLKLRQLERRHELEEEYDEGGMFEVRFKRQKVCTIYYEPVYNAFMAFMTVDDCLNLFSSPLLGAVLF